MLSILLSILGSELFINFLYGDAEREFKIETVLAFTGLVVCIIVLKLLCGIQGSGTVGAILIFLAIFMDNLMYYTNILKVIFAVVPIAIIIWNKIAYVIKNKESDDIRKKIIKFIII